MPESSGNKAVLIVIAVLLGILVLLGAVALGMYVSQSHNVPVQPVVNEVSSDRSNTDRDENLEQERDKCIKHLKKIYAVMSDVADRRSGHLPSVSEVEARIGFSSCNIYMTRKQKNYRTVFALECETHKISIDEFGINKD